MTITQPKSIDWSRLLLLAAVTILTAHVVAAQATSYGVIYDFNASPDGDRPKAGVAIGENGALYGTTSRDGQYACGTVFELTPATANSWTETVLHSFCATSGDGARPWANLVFSTEGALYGTTTDGGTSGAGTIFQLTPPPASGDPWSYSVIYSFGPSGSPNAQPLGAVLIAAGGGLFATAREGAAVAMAPPAQPGGAWSGNVIYSPLGSQIAAGLVSAAGGLFGTAVEGGDQNCAPPSGCGTVYELTPPAVAGSAWTESTIYEFTGSPGDGEYPQAALTVGPGGALYGTTLYGGTGSCSGSFEGACGTVFQLTPPAAPGGTWTESVIYNFTALDGDEAFPIASVAIGKDGVLYGTTQYGGITEGTPCSYSGVGHYATGCGIAFKLTPPTAPGGSWTETVLHRFTGKNGDGAIPQGVLSLGKNGVIWGTTNTGGVHGYGTVFELVP